MKFYQIDTDSENYFVGRMERDPDQVNEELRNLEIGETWWNPVYPSRGFERFE